MRFLPEDLGYIDRAIELAQRGRGHVRPNPPVGAVLVKGGEVVGEGFHSRCGEPHAEAEALAAAGEAAVGATAYVSLEPCSRAGRVGACSEALVAAGVKRVVWAVSDPNPKNHSGAVKAFTAAGIESAWLERAKPDMFEGGGVSDADVRRRLEAAQNLVRPFAKAIRTGLPYITVKIAMSLDGRICDDFGESRWVSSPRARKATGRLREVVDAVMIGAETLRRDNPGLMSHGRRNNDLLRFVVTGGGGRLPPRSRVFTDEAADRTFVIFAGTPVPDDFKPQHLRGETLRAVLKDVHKRLGVNHILCEGGFKLAGSLAAEGLVDEWISVVSPKVIGPQHIMNAADIGRALVLPDVGVGKFDEELI